MKNLNSKYKICFLLMMCFITINSFSQEKENLIASYCLEDRGCTGSNYCTACKNCSGCRHCSKNGGSCGVCSTYTRKVYKTTSTNQSDSSVLKKIEGKLIYGSILNVAIKNLNLREKASSKSKILEKLNQHDRLSYLSKNENWIKVKVEKSKNIGFVYGKYLY